jgi:hypothetical protein
MRAFLFSCALILMLTVQACAQQIITVKNPYPFIPGDSVSIGVIPYKSLTGRFDPPAAYEEWWQEIMSCSHLPVSKVVRDKVKWNFVSIPFRLRGYERVGEIYVGYTMAWKNEIYVIFDGITDPHLVKHEMLHYLMYQNGLAAGHPDSLFDKCGVKI